MIKKFKEFHALNEGGIEYDTIADDIYAKTKGDFKNWEKIARKMCKSYDLSKDETTSIIQMLAGEDYFDTGDLIDESEEK